MIIPVVVVEVVVVDVVVVDVVVDVVDVVVVTSPREKHISQCHQISLIFTARISIYYSE